jgi:hypothetical protein
MELELLIVPGAVSKALQTLRRYPSQRSIRSATAQLDNLV